jgi:TPR repeat protein
MYFSGVTEDHIEAVKWYRKAAEQGNSGAQFALGLIYEYGRGVQVNYAEAAKWYRRAAEQGQNSSQEKLGDMYANGRGVSQDYVQAYKWFNLAAASCPPTETDFRDKALEKREITAHKMTPPQLAEAQRLANEWKPKLSSR